jgi:uncharacterized SAM-binding protein YcdF (DUF218 family)
MRAIVIFGSTVGPDGAASRSLRRRVGYAVEAARRHPEGPVFCSGAARPGLPSEAEVIARLMAEAGIAPERLVRDDISRDTLQTAVAAAAFLRSRNLRHALVCTEHFHMARARMLLAALGVSSEPGCAAGRPHDAPTAYWRSMVLREVAAYPYDLAVVRWRRRDLMSMIEGA